MCSQSAAARTPPTLQLAASDEDLLMRLRALAAAEGSPAVLAPAIAKKQGAAAAAATAAAAAAAPSGTPRSHNNEKDFGVRLEAYRGLLQDDAADLAARVGSCDGGWDREALRAGSSAGHLPWDV